MSEWELDDGQDGACSFELTVSTTCYKRHLHRANESEPVFAGGPNGDRRSDLHKPVIVSTRPIDAPILSSTASVEGNTLRWVRGGEFHRHELAHTRVGTAQGLQLNLYGTRQTREMGKGPDVRLFPDFVSATGAPSWIRVKEALARNVIATAAAREAVLQDHGTAADRQFT
jgi:hypothetical protein